MTVQKTGGLERVPPVLFFDLDNTLIDHSGALGRGLAQVCERWPRLIEGHDFETALAAFERFNDALWVIYSTGAITAADIRRERFQQWYEYLNTGHEEMPSVAEVSTYYMECYGLASEAYPGVLSMLDALAPHHTIGIITNGFTVAQAQKLGVTGLDRYVQLRIYSEDVGVQKPHPAIFRAALEAAGASPADALYVGDNFANDIVGAARAGIATVWYNPHDEDHPQDPPDVTPDATVHSIEQLSMLLRAH